MFSLLDEPWIPVLETGGGQREVSLTELFAEAHQLRMLACELPTQNFAILRLVLAIMHRATGGPPSEQAWRTLWQDPTLPRDIQDYLGEFRDRFDLLHPQRPFYQVADLRTAKGEEFGLARIIADVPSNIRYLTARAGSGLESASPADAARWVVHCQAFDTSGIKSGAVDDPRVRGGRGYPLGVAAAGWLGGIYIEGRSLKETLLLNLVPEGIIRHSDRDLPVWERDQPGPAPEKEESKGPYGVAGLYTWQSRRVRLYGDRAGITGAMVAYGDPLDWQDLHLLEPLSVWGRSAPREKEQKKAVVYLPRPHDPARALWRGLESLLPQPASSRNGAPQRLAPRVMEWLARLSAIGVVGDDFTISPRAVSAVYASKQTVVEQIFGDALTMNVHLLRGDSELRACVVSAVADADEAVRALTRLAADLTRAAGGSGAEVDKGPVARASEIAYSRLDRHFRDWLAALGPGADPLARREAWQRGVSQTMAQLGHELITAAGPTAWVGRMVKDRNNKEIHVTSSQAEAWFRGRLRKALPLAAAAWDKKRQESPA